MLVTSQACPFYFDGNFLLRVWMISQLFVSTTVRAVFFGWRIISLFTRYRSSESVVLCCFEYTEYSTRYEKLTLTHGRCIKRKFIFSF